MKYFDYDAKWLMVEPMLYIQTFLYIFTPTSYMNAILIVIDEF
jgi:hypothetical protein